MSRIEQAVTTNEKGIETHPAFAVAILGHPSSTPGVSLFQSDLQHRSTVTLSIHRASRKRDLFNDWVHPREEIIEIEMSMAQWAQLVSSSGKGSGTPVTLRWNNGERTPSIPFEPRTAKSVEEVKDSVAKMLKELKEAVAEMNRLEDEKAPVKQRRAARATVTRLIAQAPGSAEFAAQMLDKHVENVVTQAKADVEAMVADAATAKELEDNRPRLELELL